MVSPFYPISRTLLQLSVLAYAGVWLGVAVMDVLDMWSVEEMHNSKLYNRFSSGRSNYQLIRDVRYFA